MYGYGIIFLKQILEPIVKARIWMVAIVITVGVEREKNYSVGDLDLSSSHPSQSICR